MSYLAGAGSGGGSVPSFSSNETPAGAINGINTVYTLVSAPSPSASLQLYLNGALQKVGVDFNLVGSTITFITPTPPLTGSILTAYYMY